MRGVTLLLLLGFVPRLLLCQAPAGVDAPVDADVVDDDVLVQRIEAGCERLRLDGSLRTVAALRDGADGRHGEWVTAKAREPSLSPVALRAALLASTLIVGHYYHCAECDAFHFTASTGCALAKDGVVATCFHLLQDDAVAGGDAPPTMLAVADWQGRVYPVTEVLAADRLADVAVLRCAAKDLVPLPLRADARPGERVWCLSNPDHMFASFSEGLIARRYIVRGAAPGTDEAGTEGAAGTDKPGVAAHLQRTPSGATRMFLQVTCEFGSGSSGAPIVDACGNLVGIAQSTATVVADPEAEVQETQMVARSAVSASALLALLRR